MRGGRRIFAGCYGTIAGQNLSIAGSDLKRLVITDTIHAEKQHPKIASTRWPRSSPMPSGHSRRNLHQQLLQIDAMKLVVLADIHAN